MSDYETIKAQCLKKDEFWEDPDFKAEQTSIYYRKEKWMPDWSKVVWKRPAVSIFLCLNLWSNIHFTDNLLSSQNTVEPVIYGHLWIPVTVVINDRW